jgi:hypothetical protein
MKKPNAFWFFILAIILWLDEGLNVIFIGLLRFILKLPPAAGNPHYTISQTLAELRERGSKIGCVGCKILTWIQDNLFRLSGDHCREAMQGVPEDEVMDG